MQLAFLFIIRTISGILLQADTLTTVPAEPTLSQRFVFYVLTAGGLFLLFLSFRQSKLRRRK